MPKQTVKFGKVRLARFDGIKVYSFEVSRNGIKRRAGVVNVGGK